MNRHVEAQGAGPPVLLLHGLQGAFFSPLAASFIIATLASLAVAVLVTPPLSLLLLQGARLHEEPGALVRAKDWHQRLLTRAIAAPRWAVGATGIAAAVTVAGFLLFNSELLPSFREGHFVLGVQGPPGTSLAVMRDYGQRITRDLIAIDGIVPSVAHTLFGLQRNEVWALSEVSWLLTCEDADVPIITAPPADATKA